MLLEQVYMEHREIWEWCRDADRNRKLKMNKIVGKGFFFFPRGGSAQVVRYLTSALERHGWSTSIATGSLGSEGRETNARTFFGREDLAVADYTEAAETFARGGNPMQVKVPHHPSYEDRPQVADRIFSRLDDSEAELQVSAWINVLQQTRWHEADILHLHHLTPIHSAAEQLFPTVSRITHLHGTELKFIERVLSESGAALAGGIKWVERMRLAARASRYVVCISEHDRVLASKLLEIDDDRLKVIPNGIDIERFDRKSWSPEERLALWRRWLVEDPRGWNRSGIPGSITYRVTDLAPFLPGPRERPVMIFVGRFLKFKRVDLLIRAYALARERYGIDAPLVIWGGAPGEWEGNHPFDVASRVGQRGIYFAGWRGHDELPSGLGCSDVLVAPSVNEPFGQVYLEAMACGLPVIATSTGGPMSFVNVNSDEPNGWLVPPDNEETLAKTIAEVVSSPSEIRRRGEFAYKQIRTRYSWDSLAARFIELYENLSTRKEVLGN